MIAVYVGGPRCGRTVEVVADAAPAMILANESNAHYELTDRVTKHGGSDRPGRPVYAFVPFRSAPPRGKCRCGCRRSAEAI